MIYGARVDTQMYHFGGFEYVDVDAITTRDLRTSWLSKWPIFRSTYHILQ